MAAGQKFASPYGMNTSSILTRLALGLFCLTLIPTAAAAQPVPDEGQVALGGEIGVFLPTDEQLEPGLVGGGLIEFYVSPRVGIRGSVMAMRNDYERGGDDEERQLRFGGDVIYNWEFGAVHPFAGAGIGVHLLRFYDEGENVGPNDTEVGGQILGGAEFFLNREWTVKAEGRYQWVGDRPFVDLDGLALTIGVKRYF